MSEFVIAETNTARAALFFEGFRAEEIEAELGDLLDCVRRSSGARLPLGGTRFAADCHSWRFVLDAQHQLTPGGFVMAATAQCLCVTARDMEGIGNAIYWFLERFAGVRWFWPGQTGEVVPRRDAIVVPVGIYREEPDFLWRRIGVSGPFWAPYSYNLAERATLGLSAAYQTEWERWCRRNRLGGLKIADGHRFAEILPPHRYGEEHPEYFALVGASLGSGQRDAGWRTFNGKHTHQPCTSHPDVIRITADYILRQFAADPTLAGFSIALNDGSGFCECELCRRQDEEGAQRNESTDDYMQTQETEGETTTQISDRIFRFANAVAERVAAKEPDKLILMLVYSQYRTPPRRTRLHPNVLAQFCTATNKYVMPEVEEQELNILSALSSAASHVAIYDYLEQGAWPGAPRLYAPKLAETIRAFHQHGVRYYATQPGKGFATSGLNFYLLSRCLWEAGTCSEAVLRDFYASSFGAAAAAMRKYFEAFIKRWQEFHRQPEGLKLDVYDTISRLYDEAFLQARREDLDEARRRAGAGEDVSARIDFFAKGLRFTELVVAAAATAQRLEKMGLKTDGWNSDEAAVSWERCPDKERAAHTVRTARETWDELLRWTQENTGDYVFPEFYFHYCYSRSFHRLHNFIELIFLDYADAGC